MSRCFTSRHWFLCCVVLLSHLALSEDRLWAQAGLRESLERLDQDEDGRIDPGEITPLARPYLERIAEARRLSLENSNTIESLQEAARVYYALNNGVAGRRVVAKSDSSVKPFGPEPDQVLVPEFGLPEVKYPYVQADVDEAEQTMRRYDRNRDGYIDRTEAAASKWTHRDPFEMDLDKDNRLSRQEFTQRYARRRLLSSASYELIQKAKRTGSGIRSSTRSGEDRRDESRWWRRGGSGYWLTASVLGRFDSNKNGRLESQETQALGIPHSRLDIDRDGELSREELHAFLAEQQKDAGDLSEGLPGWFYELDADRDGQVAMSEFATEWTEGKLQEFSSLDTNSDGLLTASEVAGSKAMVGGTFLNETAEVLPPRKTIISEIDVTEDFVIGDVNVTLSITHSNTSFLDAYLTGPGGQRIELFTEVGGSGDHFDETLFDDQSANPITKAKPPFSGTFMPEALVKRQPSLSQFNGKSAKGIWQLVVRGTRSERFGMLHSWGLIFRPQESMLDGSTASPPKDRPEAPGSGDSSSRPPEQRDTQERGDGAAVLRSN